MNPGAGLWRNFFRKNDPEEELTNVLEEVFLFRGLGRRDLRVVRDLMHLREYAQDEVVFFQGQPGNGMYVVVKGEVRVVMGYGSDAEVELVRLTAGDFFGEFNLLDEAPRSATVVATRPTTLGGFSRPDLMDLIRTSPRYGVEIALNLGRVLTERLRRTNEELLAASKELTRSGAVQRGEGVDPVGP